MYVQSGLPLAGYALQAAIFSLEPQGVRLGARSLWKPARCAATSDGTAQVHARLPDLGRAPVRMRLLGAGEPPSQTSQERMATMGRRRLQPARPTNFLSLE